MLTRNIIALVSTLVLTIAPAWYQFSLRNKAPANFPALIETVDSQSLVPSDWSTTDGGYEFDDQWRERLGLKHHWSINAASPDGDSLVILFMLSEAGEQIYHTPEVCYEAVGCQINGTSIARDLPSQDMGTYRMVEVEFPSVLDERTGVASWAYWTGSEWVSPEQANIHNVMTHEPFLLKLQVLLENETIDSPTAQQSMDDYLTFLGNRLRTMELLEVAIGQ